MCAFRTVAPPGAVLLISATYGWHSACTVPDMGPRPRVVVACPDLVESEVISEWLSEEHEPVPARLLPSALHQVQTRQAHLVVADARIAFDDTFLSTCRGGGAPTPLVVIGDSNPSAEAAAQRRGAFYVVRPVDREMLLCSVGMALVDARPVRRSPRITVGRLEATADGIPVALLDVANEGVRLEIPRGERSTLPPFFTVRVPMIGVSIAVQRIWVSTPGHLSSAQTWCGGALVGNPAHREQKWRKFVEMVPRSH